MDTKLGVIDPGLRCKTCGGRAGECPGHFGHIELVAPVIHVGFAKLIRKILRQHAGIAERCYLIQPRKRDCWKDTTLKKMGQSIEDVVNEVFKEARKRVSASIVMKNKKRSNSRTHYFHRRRA